MKAEKDVIDKELHLQQQKLMLPDLSSVSTFCMNMCCTSWLDSRIYAADIPV